MNIKYLIQDYWKVGLIIILVLMTMLLFFVNKSKQANEGLVGLTDSQEVVASELQQNFSILSLTDTSYSKNRIYLELSLYQKNATLSSADFKIQMDNLIEMYKWKYNNEDKNIAFIGAKIKVYDRIFDYSNSLSPRTVVTFGLNSNLLEKDEIAKLNEEYFDESLVDLAKNMKDYPETYEKFHITSSYVEIDSDKFIQALSTQEQQLTYKLATYQTLLGEHGDFSNVLYKLMVWEYGVDITNTGSAHLIRNEFSNFYKRVLLTTPSASTKILEENKFQLQEKYAIKNPRFLVYILLDKHTYTVLEAKKELIDYDRDFFLPIFIEDAKNSILNDLEDTSSIEAIEDNGITESNIDDYDTSNDEIFTEDDLEESDDVESELDLDNYGESSEEENSNNN